MSIQMSEGFSLLSKDVLDKRISYNTIAEMKSMNDAYLYDGCIASIKNDNNKKTYQWWSTNEVDETLGKWREIELNGNKNLWIGTKEEFDAIENKSNDVIYITTDEIDADQLIEFYTKTEIDNKLIDLDNRVGSSNNYYYGMTSTFEKGENNIGIGLQNTIESELDPSYNILCGSLNTLGSESDVTSSFIIGDDNKVNGTSMYNIISGTGIIIDNASCAIVSGMYNDTSDSINDCLLVLSNGTDEESGNNTLKVKKSGKIITDNNVYDKNDNQLTHDIKFTKDGSTLFTTLSSSAVTYDPSYSNSYFIIFNKKNMIIDLSFTLNLESSLSQYADLFKINLESDLFKLTGTSTQDLLEAMILYKDSSENDNGLSLNLDRTTGIVQLREMGLVKGFYRCRLHTII